MSGAELAGPRHGRAHDSENTAAAYLGGGLRPRAARAFERHLLDCEKCWREVDLGRAGRRLAESAREAAPPELREHLRAVISSEVRAEGDTDDCADSFADDRADGFARPPRRRTTPASASSWSGQLVRGRGRWVLAAGGLVLGAAVSFGLLLGPGRGSVGGSGREPAAVTAAVADYRALRLPGTSVPDAQAPDLASVRLRPMGAASGLVGGRQVTAYSYSDAAGRNVMVYLSRDPFPTAAGARHLAGPDGPWIATSNNVTVLCARSPHALLVLGLDRQLVLDVARSLNVT